MSDDRDYILGTDDAELERLRQQHQCWAGHAHRLFERAGLRAGQRVLDLGCGPGFTSLQLADAVGPTGRVLARDTSERYLASLQRELDHRRLRHVEPSLGAVETLDLPTRSLDAAYSRWLLCWLPDPAAALRRVAAAMRPGGVVMCQEYLDWAAMKLVPRSAPFDRAVAACMRSWELGGGHIDLAERLPGLAAECGLRVASFEPVARAGAPDTPVWRWIETFFRTYPLRLLDQGLISSAELDAVARDFDERRRAGVGYACAPLMADVILVAANAPG
ncbi:MAG: methyltransferase domain-containing protein [Planctomycetota bacterium]